MRKDDARTYLVKAELRVVLNKSTLVAENDDAVAAAVRHRLRGLPVEWTRNGMRFEPNFVYVEVEKLGEVKHERDNSVGTGCKG